ncbi:hypothetical protein L202_06122 [Cryptococcus amylolentus CBS 6039]|uniref:DNA 3'-5' helicase n=2 Tax=Cryptococcus amylolentus TaxID=104669 RepID=A0A1E3HL76_9TREE|nr:hypothetical protein L202_06122 [Cryptococcus amylolentus CBS 6039]ODN76201.1 hypothetical protein L202_06122 [Cryptococcus amylolentus CBS 6039]ODN96317.1 hypothetical protein I350_08339 [Cryptococcus amylolentus CBS 6273]
MVKGTRTYKELIALFLELVGYDLTPGARLPRYHEAILSLAAVPQTIIFVRTKTQCNESCALLMMLIGVNHNKVVDTFHSSTPADERDAIMARLRSGETRILCATDAFGIGCDVPKFRNSVFYGCAANINDLCQKGGRAVRDNAPANVFIFTDLRRSKEIVEGWEELEEVDQLLGSGKVEKSALRHSNHDAAIKAATSFLTDPGLLDLDLPRYGLHRHQYEEVSKLMLEAEEEILRMPRFKRRVVILCEGLIKDLRGPAVLQKMGLRQSVTGDFLRDVVGFGGCVIPDELLSLIAEKLNGWADCNTLKKQ